MCGILGFNFKDEGLARELADLIKHRGPDQGGFYFDDNLSLGHRRLSILDLSEKGKQPMTIDGEDFIIVFNGEIFNYLEIKDDLLKKGHSFYSKTDTEVLLRGYKEYGYKILDKLNGQFAFSIYDKRKKELFLARDRVGINPLYYYFDNKKFIFGSELKVLMNSGIDKEIDKFSLNYYLMYGYTPLQKTILKNCFKLLPAHFLKFSLKENKIKKIEKYWDFKMSGEINNEDEAKKLILEKLDKSVKDRMVADVPVGAFLSGGVDSSAVVAMMSKYTKDINTFSIKFDHSDFDESEYAEIVSKKFNTKHNVIKFFAKDVRELMPKLIYHYDEPFADPSMIPTFLVSKVARKYVTVSLSGDGGDELFGGYPSYLRYRLINIQKYFPRFLFYFFYFVVSKLNINKLIKLKKFLRIGSINKKLKFAEFKSFLYREEFEKISDENPEKYYTEYVGDNYIKGDFLQKATNIDIRNYLVNNCLTKVDRASLGNSLESRSPILDHEMIELAASISSKLKIKNGETKYIFKKALEGILPDEILYRAKKGFSVPLKYYLRGELKDLAYKYVIDYNKHDFFKKDIINEIKKNLEKKEWEKDYSRIIWSIMMFNMWYDKWILNND